MSCIAGSLVTNAPSGVPSVTEELWGKVVDGTPIYLYTLRNSHGTTVQVTNYGATIISVKTADREGKFDDIVLGYGSANECINGKPNFNSVVGRYANRIANAQFELDGRVYRLNANNGKNHLHGGPTGFYSRLFQSTPIVDSHYSAVEFKYTSADGEEGYPGALNVRVVYKLTAGNTLRMEFYADTATPTIVNLCNHAYWNLSGHSSSSLSILNHKLLLNASRITPVDENMIPTGIASVKDYPHLDFTQEKTIGADIAAFEKLDPPARGGYDHNFVIDRDDPQGDKSAAKMEATKLKMASTNDSDASSSSSSSALKMKMQGSKMLGKMITTGVDGVTIGQVFAGRLSDPSSGRVMDVYTTAPGIQVYTGNWLDGSIIGRNGVRYEKYAAVCLETQNFPNAPNTPSFPSAVLRPGQSYVHITSHHFFVAPSSS